MKPRTLTRQALFRVEGSTLCAIYDSHQGRPSFAGRETRLWKRVRVNQIAYEIEPGEHPAVPELSVAYQSYRVEWRGDRRARSALLVRLPSYPAEDEQMWVESHSDSLMFGNFWPIDAGGLIAEFSSNMRSNLDSSCEDPSAYLVMSGSVSDRRLPLEQVGCSLLVSGKD